VKALYFALATAVVWGSVPILEKMGLVRLSPYAAIFVRCLAVALGSIFLLVLKPEILPELSRTPAKYIALIMVGGFCANFLGQMFFYHALKEGDVSRVVPISGIYPLISFILGVLILGEKITVAKSAGILCVIAGVFLLR